MTTFTMSSDRLKQLERAKTVMYAGIEEMYHKGEYTELERRWIDALRRCSNFQLEAECSWHEFNLMRSLHDAAYLEDIIQQWDQTPSITRPTVTREASEERLRDLREDIAEMELMIKEAREKGCFWSIIPLLEYFALPEEERVGTSFYPLLPSFTRKMYDGIQSSTQRSQQPERRRIGPIDRLKRFRIRLPFIGGEVDIEANDIHRRDTD